MISQILDEVVAIGHLSRMRQDLAHGFCKAIGPIPADDLNLWMSGEPGRNRFGGPVCQEIEGSARFGIDEYCSIAISSSHGSGKGNDVAIIPSPKNRAGHFHGTRLKPFSSPVSPDAVSPRVDPGYELADDRWDEATPGFLPDLSPKDRQSTG